MTLRLVAAPADPILDLDEVKAQLNLETDDHDLLLEALVATAAGNLDGATGTLNRALVTQTWALDLDDFPRPAWGLSAPGHGGLTDSERYKARPNAIALPLPPLVEVTEITYYDLDGVQQTLDPSAYNVFPGDEGLVEPAPLTCWPLVQRGRSRAATITFTAGFGGSADVPAPIKHAMKLLISHWFQNRDAVVGVENRDSSAPLPLGVDALLTPWRAWPR